MVDPKQHVPTFRACLEVVHTLNKQALHDLFSTYLTWFEMHNPYLVFDSELNVDTVLQNNYLKFFIPLAIP